MSGEEYLSIPYDNLMYQFCAYDNYSEELRDKFEKEVIGFVKEEWNPELKFYVELEDTYILSIMVCDDIRRSCFEMYVIKPLCKKYGLEIQYVETMESDTLWIEWGLGLKEKENI